METARKHSSSRGAIDVRKKAAADLSRMNLMHRYVKPRAERLPLGEHLFVAAERVFEIRMLRLDQEREFALVRPIQ